MMLLFLVSLLLLIGLLVVLLLPFPEYVTLTTTYKKVSILIAARNEEAQIKACLDALLAQDYPKEYLEIIVGDDDSSDQTLSILKSYESLHDQLKVIAVKSDESASNGKKRMLFTIDKYATGELLLFTDADTIANPNWVSVMVKALGGKEAIVTGMTIPKGGLFSLQGIDWVFALIQVIKLSALGVPTTSMGNNMGVKADAYFKLGGYAQVKESLTEDFELFRKFVKAGYKYRFVFQQESLLITKPIKGLLNLLHQRKRWMTGAVKLPWVLVLLLLLLALFYPIVFVGMCFDFWTFVALWGLKIFFQCLIILFAYQRLKLRVNPLLLVLHEFYSLFLTLSLLLFYVLPIKVKWKGRVYK